MEAARRDATMEGRLATVSLTLFPVLIGTLLLAFDPNTAVAVRSALGVAILVASAVLTGAGAWWLWTIAAPPFAAFPGRRSILERQPQTADDLSAILHQAAIYAEQGMEVADALEHAASEDASHPSRALVMGLRVLLEPGTTAAEGDDADPTDPTDGKAEHPKRPDGNAARDGDGPDAADASDENEEVGRSAAEEARAELPDWLISALQRGWTGTQPGWAERDPVETLHLLAVRIRDELGAAAHAWPGRVRIAALVPFGICILPAAVLLALLSIL